MVLLTLLINLGLVAILLNRESRSNPYVSSPPVTILEAYFLRNGSWKGVEGIFNNDAGFPGPPPRTIWENTVLVDNSSRILLEHGGTASPEIGTIYQPVEGALAVPLIVNNQTVGKLYIERNLHAQRLVFGDKGSTDNLRVFNPSRHRHSGSRVADVKSGADTPLPGHRGNSSCRQRRPDRACARP